MTTYYGKNRLVSRVHMKLIGWVMVYAPLEGRSEQGVKTRSSEGVGVTDAGKGSILLSVSCFGWEGR